MFGWFSKKFDASAVEKHAKVVGTKRSAGPDRWDALQALATILRAGEKAPPDVGLLVTRALLPRFSFNTDPSISDEEEKDFAFRLIVEAGGPAVEAIRGFARRSESVTWPIRMLDRLLPTDGVVAELLGWLAEMDTDYERDPQRKLQVLQTLEDRPDARVGDAVARFTTDASEPVRFHAVGVLLAQSDHEAWRKVLRDRLDVEESARVRGRILEAFGQRGWPCADVKSLPPGWSIDSTGLPRRR